MSILPRVLQSALLALLLCTGQSGFAATNLDELLKQARDARRSAEQQQRQRETEFRQARDRQQQMLEQVRERLTLAEAKSVELREAFAENEDNLARLEEQIREASGDLGDLSDVIHQAAGALEVEIRESLSSAQFPQRGDKVAEIAQRDSLPPMEELEHLWLTLLEGMTLDGKVSRFTAPVMLPSGAAVDREVVRFGPFTAIGEGKYLNWLPGPSVLAELERQPGFRYQRLAAEIDQAGDGWANVAIDPTRGSLLNLLVQAPDLDERLHQGGLVGYLIIALGALGLLLALFRLFRLWYLAHGVKRQLRALDTPQNGNPLGRILLAAEEVRDAPLDLLESKIDEAILREMPGLERGRGFLKLLAAVAPMLGLLGTITGLIVTFQAISLFGTGDPKLMADGISQALVTTLLGLSVAVPLLFLNSLLNARGNALLQTLEERSAGLVANMLEQRRA